MQNMANNNIEEKFADFPIEEYKNRYTVSSNGKIISKRTKTPLTTKISNNYNVVSINKINSKQRLEYRVDEIIAQAFFGSSDLYLSHKDGNYLNDRLDNLEYTTIENHLKNIYGCEWKQIDNNPKYYVSSNGKVWSSYKNIEIKQQITSGFKSVNIGYPAGKFYCVHELVARYFIENPYKYPLIHHKDFDIHNNSSDNLLWTTQEYINKYRKEYRETKDNENNSNEDNNTKKDKNTTIERIKLLEEKGDYGTELKEYPGYIIYRDSSVFSKKTNDFLTPNKNGSGYDRYRFCIESETSDHFAHVLVAKAYLSHTKLPEHTQVNHKNLNKNDNSVDNLEWCTSSENISHSKENNKSQHSHLQKKVAKLEQDTCEIIEIYDGLKEACRKNIVNGKPLNSGTLSKICNNSKKRDEEEIEKHGNLIDTVENKKKKYGCSGGYRWKYI
jgi:hypothetical protein